MFTNEDIERVARVLRETLWTHGCQLSKEINEELARAAIEAMPIRELVDLVQTLIDNDPSEPISDAGHTVLDGWRARAKVVLARHDRR